MSEDSPTLLKISNDVARLEGKLDAYQATSKLELLQLNRDIQDGKIDRTEIHRSVLNLQLWRAWTIGIGSGLGMVLTVISVLALLHTLRVI